MALPNTDVGQRHFMLAYLVDKILRRLYSKALNSLLASIRNLAAKHAELCNDGQQAFLFNGMVFTTDDTKPTKLLHPALREIANSYEVQRQDILQERQVVSNYLQQLLGHAQNQADIKVLLPPKCLEFIESSLPDMNNQEPSLPPEIIQDLLADYREYEGLINKRLFQNVVFN